MPTPAELWRWDGIPAPAPSDTNPTWQADSYLKETFLLVSRVLTTAQAAARDSAAALAIVKAQATADAPLTDEEVERIAERVGLEFDERIDSVEAEVTLNVSNPTTQGA